MASGPLSRDHRAQVRSPCRTCQGHGWCPGSRGSLPVTAEDSVDTSAAALSSASLSSPIGGPQGPGAGRPPLSGSSWSDPAPASESTSRRGWRRLCAPWASVRAVSRAVSLMCGQERKCGLKLNSETAVCWSALRPAARTPAGPRGASAHSPAPPHPAGKQEDRGLHGTQSCTPTARTAGSLWGKPGNPLTSPPACSQQAEGVSGGRRTGVLAVRLQDLRAPRCSHAGCPLGQRQCAMHRLLTGCLFGTNTPEPSRRRSTGSHASSSRGSRVCVSSSQPGCEPRGLLHSPLPPPASSSILLEPLRVPG